MTSEEVEPDVNRELLHILENIEREKGINREILFAAIESALASAARKVAGAKKDDVTVTVDRETGAVKVMSEGKEIRSAEFGRIAAQTAKQVIIQKIREAEREVIYGDFHDRVNTLCTGSVHRFERGSLIIDLGRTEGVLPRKDLCPHDNFKQGDRVRAYIVEVNKSQKGPEITLSRAHPNFVKKLFELEVPEISDNIVEIKDIAREPGDRTKMSVHSKDDKVDSVGACVGMRGQRVKNIVRELGGERIDIIRWGNDVKEYIKSALSPAEIKSIAIDRKRHQAVILVADDQLSLAIGKQGQNVRLASKLTGWNIDIMSEGDYKAISQVPLRELDGVGPKAEKVLKEAGFDNIAKIAETTAQDLSQLDGIGEKTAERMIESAKALLKEKKGQRGQEKKRETVGEPRQDISVKEGSPQKAEPPSEAAAPAEGGEAAPAGTEEDTGGPAEPKGDADNA